MRIVCSFWREFALRRPVGQQHSRSLSRSGRSPRPRWSLRQSCPPPPSLRPSAVPARGSDGGAAPTRTPSADPARPADAVPPPPPRRRVRNPGRGLRLPNALLNARLSARLNAQRRARNPRGRQPRPRRRCQPRSRRPPSPPPAQPPPQSDAVPNWRNELLGRLQRAKRYPTWLRAHGDQGSAAVTFTMDRAGRVLSVTLARSSGSPLLDDEPWPWSTAPNPLPPRPQRDPGNTITFTIPVNFALALNPGRTSLCETCSNVRRLAFGPGADDVRHPRLSLRPGPPRGGRR